MQAWRWIDTGSQDGAMNMAVDQALLESAPASGQCMMRVYQWHPYCISLGYHQKSQSLDFELCRKAEIDVVRRPTGGRAVYHADELTYSVVIPENNPFYTTQLGDVYNRISQGLIKGLQQIGVPATWQKRSPDLRAHYKTSLSLSCFSAAARHEVMVDDKKLVGSAQRKLPQGVLQHGSILLGDEHLKLPDFFKNVSDDERTSMKETIGGKTMSIHQVLNRDLPLSDLRKALQSGMAEAFSVSFEEDGLTEEEAEKASSLKDRFWVSPKEAEQKVQGTP